MLYRKFSEFLKERYGEKVYKLPINLPVTCPNRDGTCGQGGCIFCGEEGAGFESLSNQLPVREQIVQNAKYIGESYKAAKFIPYFQNYSNTYLPFDDFCRYMREACVDHVAAIYLSTRPDCVQQQQLDFLSGLKAETGIDVVLELGLQTVNYHTLKVLNRGHGLAEFIDAAVRIRRTGLDCCAHYIVDLPMDTLEDVKEGAKILSALEVQQVKCHSLYILKDTVLGDMYSEGNIAPISMEEYMERMMAFLEYLHPDIVIQRLVGRAPQERSLFCNWNTSWWKIRDMLENKMQEEGRYQGKHCTYLNGWTVDTISHIV